MIFRHRFGTPFFRILVPTWPHFAPQLGPKIASKSIQEPSKIYPKSHLLSDPFFDRFLIDFWSIFDPQIDQKSIKNRSTNHPDNSTTEISKTLKIHWFFLMFFATSAMLCYVRKSINMVPTSIRKCLSNQHPNLDRFWSDFGPKLGGKMGPSWHQNLKNGGPKTMSKNELQNLCAG